MRCSWMTGIAAACGLAMTMLACGPGNVAPDDDAQLDDDAAIGDDDLAGDDDAATGGTGTISVTVEVLAVLAEGQSVEAEIVVDGEATGVFPPAEIEVGVGSHTVELHADGFVAAPHEVTVERDGTAECGMFLGRDLGGMWQWISSEDWTAPDDNPFEAWMEFDRPEPCSSRVWVLGNFGVLTAFCLTEGDQLQYIWDDPSYQIVAEGNVLDNGSQIRYSFTDAPEEFPRGPHLYARSE